MVSNSEYKVRYANETASRFAHFFFFFFFFFFLSIALISFSSSLFVIHVNLLHSYPSLFLYGLLLSLCSFSTNYYFRLPSSKR